MDIDTHIHNAFRASVEYRALFGDVGIQSIAMAEQEQRVLIGNFADTEADGAVHL
jgi:hypothetical protein